MAASSTTEAGENRPPAPPSLGVIVSGAATAIPDGSVTVNSPEARPTVPRDGPGGMSCGGATSAPAAVAVNANGSGSSSSPPETIRTRYAPTVGGVNCTDADRLAGSSATEAGDIPADFQV